MKTIDQRIAEMCEQVKKNWRTRFEFVETVQAAAIAVFGIEKESFFNGERTRDVSYARMASMAICRERTKLSLHTIGMLHGGLDHTAVHYAFKKSKSGKQGIFSDGKSEIERLISQSIPQRNRMQLGQL